MSAQDVSIIHQWPVTFFNNPKNRFLRWLWMPQSNGGCWKSCSNVSAFYLKSKYAHDTPFSMHATMLLPSSPKP